MCSETDGPTPFHSVPGGSGLEAFRQFMDRYDKCPGGAGSPLGHHPAKRGEIEPRIAKDDGTHETGASCAQEQAPLALADRHARRAAASWSGGGEVDPNRPNRISAQRVPGMSARRVARHSGGVRFGEATVTGARGAGRRGGRIPSNSGIVVRSNARPGIQWRANRRPLCAAWRLIAAPASAHVRFCV